LLRSAFREVVEAYEILHPAGQAPELHVVDLCALHPEALHRAAESIALEPLPLSPENGTVLRAALIQLNGELCLLRLDASALSADRASLEILAADLARACAALSGGSVELPEEAPPYSAVSAVLLDLLEAPEAEEAREYWRAFDLTALAEAKIAFGRSLPPGRAERLRSAPVPLAGSPPAAGQGLTPFLLGAWIVLLWRLGGDDRVPLGVVLDGRGQPELVRVVGPLARCLPAVFAVRSGLRFRDLAAQVRSALREQAEYQDFFHVPDSDGAGEAWFPFAFDLHSTGSLPAAGRLRLAIQSLGFRLDRCGLRLSGLEHPGGLVLEIVYDSGRYLASEAYALADQLAGLLADAAARPAAAVESLSLFTQAQRQALLVDFNRAPMDLPETALTGLFAAQVARTPQRTALVCGDERITYAELSRRTGRFARELRRLGVGPEETVAVCLPRSTGMVVALLAVLKAGGAYVPLDPDLTAERLRLMLADSGSRFLLTSRAASLPADLESSLPPGGLRLAIEDCDPADAADSGDPEWPVDPDSLAYAIYTSGSTGKPKGVAVTHRALVNFLLSMLRKPGIAETDVLAAVTTISFDIAGLELYLPLLAGAQVLLVSREVAADGFRLARLLDSGEPTILQATPSTWKMLLATGWKPRPGLRMLCGGEGLPAALAKELTAGCEGLTLWNLYGPTETTIWSTALAVRAGDLEARRTTVPLGRPVANTALYLLRQDLEPAAWGEPGEIYLGGAGLARGYLGRPDLSAERFLPDLFSAAPGARLYRVGDLARLLPGGILEFLGRTDHQVKVRGHRIELGEIEAVLCRHGGVAEAAVTARPDASGGQQLAAFFVPAAADDVPSAADLTAFLRRFLPEPMVPSALLPLSRLPLTPNGKIDRRALAGIEISRHPSAGSQEPSGDTEVRLAALWREVLGLERMGAQDGFFTLGGHSLTATLLAHRAGQAFAVDLSPAAIFQHPTIAGLAREIEARQRESPAGTVAAQPRTGAAPRFPLSFAQQRLWFIQQYLPESPAYNLAGVARFRGPLDAGALAAALGGVVDRHEVLRTTYETDGESAVQVIHPSGDLHLAVIDLAGECDPEAAALARIASEVRRPFDLRGGPVLRASLLRLAAEEHLFLLEIHHIASDAWSNDILMAEVTVLYGAARAGRETATALPPLPVQYADFAVWQRAWLTAQRLEGQISYWRTTLAEAEPLQLPSDRPRPRRQRFTGERLPHAIPAPLPERLAEIGRRAGATPFAVLLSALGILLHRHSGQDDIVLGAPFTGRLRPEVERLIGFFVNTLPLRLRFGVGASLGTVLDAAREMVLGAHTHQELPFERLVDELAIEREPGRTPVYCVVFNYQGAAETLPGLEPALSCELVEPDPGTSKFDLTLALQETPGGLRGFLEYDTGLFDPGTAARLAAGFTTLLAGIAACAPDLSQSPSELPLLSPAEFAQLTSGRLLAPVPAAVPAAGGAADDLLHLIFARRAAEHPERIAVRSGDRSLSYGALDRHANQVAHFLRCRGVGAETRVGLCFERSFELLVALLGVLKAGGTYVPLDPSSPEERLSFIARDAGLCLVLAQAESAERFPAGLAVAWDEELFRRRPAAAPDIPEDGGCAAYIIYTSGSTGRPKGVVVPHRNAARLFRSTQGWFGFGDDDVWTLFHSYAFDFSVWEIWGALLHGGRLVVVPYWTSRSPRDFYALLAAEGVTVLNQTPSAFAQLIRAEADAGLPPAALFLRYVVFGGEALDVKTLEPWIQRHGDSHPRLINMFGITETTVHVTWRPIVSADLLSAVPGSPIGVAIPDLSLYLLDAAMGPVPLGAGGELYVGGAGLARGYLNRPDLTAERFVPSPFELEAGARLYKTGDGARLLAGGELLFLGRLDNQVQIRGFRVELGEVQATLAAHPAVHQCAVLALPTREGGLELGAYLVLRSGGTDIAGLRRFLAGRLPDYMIPRRFTLLAEFPVTSHGKLDLRALQRGKPVEVREARFAAPEGAVEEALAAIWAEALGAEKVGRDDNFFLLGGDSILSIQVLGQARERGLTITLQQLFEHQTIHALAREITTEPALPAEAAQPFDLISPEVRARLPAGIMDAYPLSWLQLGMIYEMQLQSEDPPYHNVDSVGYRLRIDRPAFETAVAWAVARHAVLRTSFHLTGYGEALQLVHATAELPLLWQDLRGLPPAAQEEVLRDHVAAERRRLFDLSRPPLLRFALHQLADDFFRFTVTEFHPILDGWSLTMLLRDIFTAHERLATGSAASDEPPPRAGFKDFIRLERAAMGSEESRSFWQQTLAGRTPVKLPRWPALPESGARTGVREARYTVVPAQLDRLKKLARRARVPLKSVLLAAHANVLGFLTGSSSVVTGVQLNGRPEVEGGDRICGLFLNSLPLRLDAGAGSWLELAQRSFAAELASLPHRRFPMSEIQRLFGRGGPLFESFFNYVHFHAAEEVFATGELAVEGESVHWEPTHFPFSADFNLSSRASTLTVTLQSAGDGFPQTQLDAVLTYYRQALASMADGAESEGAPRGLPSLLPGAERSWLLAAWRGEEAAEDGGASFPQIFAAQARRTPSAVALVQGDCAMTYGELDRRSSQVAHHLIALGAGPEATVGLCVERSLALIIGILGILKAGGAYVPLDPRYPEERLRHMLADSGARVLLTQESLAPRLAGLGAPAVLLDSQEAEISRRPETPPEVALSRLHLAYVIYTSGSTGLPKGVGITHGSLSGFVRAVHRDYGIRTRDRVLQFSSISFDISVEEIFPTLACGATVVLAGRHLLAGGQMVELIAAQAVTVVDLPTSYWHVWTGELHRSSTVLPECLRLLIVGGERASAAVLRAWLELAPSGCRFLNSYGPTETTVAATRFTVAPPGTDHGLVDLMPIGRPLCNSRVLLLDAAMSPVPTGIPGELYIGGSGLARGYLGQPGSTAERFVPDPFPPEERPGERIYRSGDLARTLPTGDLEFTGRMDFQVKIRGFRVETAEVEAALERHPGLDSAVVTTWEAGAGNQLLVAYVIAAGQPLSTAELRETLVRNLPEHMIPALFIELPSLPLTAQGKVDRSALPPPQPGRDRSLEYVAPRTAAEELLAGIWAQILGVPRVGAEDRFLDLGGHSLLAIQVASRVRDASGAALGLKGLLENRSVAELARSIGPPAAQSPAPAIPRAPAGVDLPLSFSQERLWFLDRLDPGSAVYNMPLALRVEGDLRVDLLRRCFTAIVQRHSALRTRFAAQDGRPRQIVEEPGEVPLPLVDLRGLAAEDGERQARQQMGEAAQVPFDLRTGPLLRLTLLLLEERRSFLFLNIHHIASDGWSMLVLARELAALYPAFLRGEAPPLPELPVQYADYAWWQRQEEQEARTREHLEFWERGLAGAAALQLATDRPRPAVQTHTGRNVLFRLPDTVAASAASFGRQAGATPFVVLLAAFAVLLYRYSHQSDLSIGTPVANRDRSELEPLVGFFVNTLVLRLALDGEPGFGATVSRTQAAAIEAFAHQEAPFEQVVERLHPERDLSRSPLFQVLFSLAEVTASPEAARVELPGVTLVAQPLAERAAKFDLSLEMVRDDAALSGSFEHNSDLFDLVTIERMALHASQLLAALIDRPDAPVATRPLLGAAEIHQTVMEWNDTRAERRHRPGVHTLFEERAAKAPEALALQSGDATFSAGDLDAAANRLAHFLHGQGVGPETLVGLCLERSPEMIIALLAIFKAGAAYLPIDPQAPRERSEFMVRDSGLCWLLTAGGAAPAGLAARTLDLVRDWDRFADHPGTPLDGGHDPQRLAYVIYTSGSTGRPKGVAVSHAAMVNHSLAAAELFRLGPGDRVLQFCSLGFDASIEEIFPSLATGAALVLHPHRHGLSTSELLGVVARHRITVLDLPTAYWQTLAQDIGRLGEEVPPTLRLTVVGGEKADLSTLSLWRRMDRGEGRWINTYGPTEATVSATAYPAYPTSRGTALAAVLPIGRPLDNYSAHLLDRRALPVPIGVPGELALGGIGLARGYVGDPRLTAARFIPDPFSGLAGERLYLTGDLVRFLPDGNLEFLGRTDSQVKVRGFRVELGEIEEALLRFPALDGAAVIPQPEPGGAVRLVAYAAGADLRTAELRAFLRERLPEFMVPSTFVILEALPLTLNGKVDRNALSRMILKPSAETTGEKPRGTPAEEMVAGVWEEVLGLDRVGVSESFFELGGHSLLATSIVSRLGRIFGVDLPVRALFEAPTVRELAHRLETVRSRGEQEMPPPILPVSRERERPLSFAQERLWFIDQLDPGNASYNIPDAVRFWGRLDVAALTASLCEIVRRHEALRTVFASDAGHPRQVIRREMEQPAPGAPVIDLSGLPETIREDRASHLAAEESVRPFDLSRGPLIRLVLFRLRPDEHIALLNLHHIISDGWSTAVFLRELGLLYQTALSRRPSPLPELAVQYADFAVWQRSWLSGSVLEGQLAFWRAALEGAPQVLELPLDRPRPAVPATRGGAASRSLPRDLSAALAALARREGATLFMTLLSVLAALLARHSGQEDLLVGTPIANRNRLETEGLIGFFVNTLVLRGDLRSRPDPPGFREVLRRIRESTLEAHVHQDLPFEKLVEALAPERDLGRTPLFQVMFGLANVPAARLELPDLRWCPVPLAAEETKFDLTLNVQDDDDGLHLRFEHRLDLFDPATIRRLLGHLAVLLEGIVRDPEARPADLPLLSVPERHQAAAEWNDTAVDFAGAPLHERVAAQAEKTPDAPAVLAGGQSMTCRELDRRSARLARRLRRLGIGPEAVVGLCAERTPDALVALLAILRAGGAYLPLDPASPRKRLELMLADAGAAALIGHASLLSNLTAPPGIPTLTLGLPEMDPDQEAPLPAVEPEHLAYILYTSGSTGSPKGAMITHRGLSNYIDWSLGAYLPEKEGENGRGGAPVHSSFAFDLTVTSLLVPLAAGRTVDLLPDGVEALTAALRTANGYDLVKLTPAHLDVLGQTLAPEELAGRTGLLVIGGEALLAETVSPWLQQAPGTRLVNEYGPTETVVGCAVHEVTSSVPGAVPIGRPIANVQLHVLNGSMQPLPIGVAGELYIGGAGLARGYLRRPDLTAERFVPDPFGEPGGRLYRTGDRARRSPEGILDFLGRLDQQIKVRGYRVELGEVEAALAAHHAVKAVVADVWSTAQGGSQLVAWVVRAADAAPALAASLRVYLQERLPQYMIPDLLVDLAELPLTPNGKVDRRALGKLLLSPGRVLPTPYDRPGAPRTLTELHLVRIWEELLGREPIGVQDNFFSLGGHSLLAVRLLARIRQQFCQDLPLASLFQNPTVETLAATLPDGTGGAATATHLIEIQRGGAEKPFFCVHPIGGSVFCYVDLARQLGRSLPFYGLQALENDGAETIEEMASQYLISLQAVQSDGPYRLGGWSMGGLIAYEIARQLTAAGEQVEVLALIDTELPQAGRASSSREEAAIALEFASDLAGLLQAPLFMDAAELGGLSADEALAALFERARAARTLPPGLELAEIQLRFKIFRRNWHAIHAYVPLPYSGEVLLFIAADRGDLSRDESSGWTQYTVRSSVHEVPGNHFTILTHLGVEVLAKRLGGVLGTRFLLSE